MPILIVVLFAAIRLMPNATRTATLEPAQLHDYELHLSRGQSADVVVRQKGVDVVVELRAPDGTLIDAIDGPTGRTGDEQFEVIAKTTGRYRLRIRPFAPNEPSGAYEIEVRAIRSAAATRELLAQRKALREEATDWLRTRSGSLTGDVLGKVATRARVIGLGEATHGSRELNDVRLAVTKRLIEQHGYRIVALEASASLLAALAPYVAGDSATPPVAVAESGWIGARAQRELVAGLRAWNLAHPADRVRLVGLDPSDSAPARETVRTLVQQAYGEEWRARWSEAEKVLAKADQQAMVFGDSSVSAEVRDFLFELQARLAIDAPILRAHAAQEAAQILAEFADFNAGGRSRDWSMAARLLAELEGGGRAVFWAHNAHVANARRETTGSLLRTALGCGYAPLAITFGAGAFLAQVPDETRLAVSELPQAADESVESVFAPLGFSMTAWPCGADPASAPQWLRAPHPMRWVGALWTPGSLPSAAVRPFDLLHDFDGLIYVPRVTAEEAP